MLYNKGSEEVACSQITLLMLERILKVALLKNKGWLLYILGYPHLIHKDLITTTSYCRQTCMSSRLEHWTLWKTDLATGWELQMTTGGAWNSLDFVLIWIYLGINLYCACCCQWHSILLLNQPIEWVCNMTREGVKLLNYLKDFCTPKHFNVGHILHSCSLFGS